MSTWQTDGAAVGQAGPVHRRAVRLGVYQVGDVTYRGRVGEVFIPADLAGVVRAVRGLDDRAQAQPHAIVAHAATVSYAPQEVGRRYGFPAAGTAAFGFVRSSAG